MAFLSPLFLLGALTASIPIVLHLLRREPEARVPFAAVELLRSTPVEVAHRRRISQLLLLALRVSALLALTLAFSRPLVTSGVGAADGGITVVALDTSLSTSAPSHFARAQQLARQAVDDAPSGDTVGLVTFADEAVPAVDPTGDRTRAHGAIQAARPGVGATSYRAALSAAAQMLSNRAGRIVVVTDLQASGWNRDDRVSLPDQTVVEVRDSGTPPPNLAVTALRAVKDGLVATIASSAPEGREVTARLEIDGVPAGEVSSPIEPGRTVEVRFGAARGGAARVSIEDREGLAGDNDRYLVLDAVSGPPLLLITSSGDLDRDAFYVKQALTTVGSDGAGLSVSGLDGAQASTMEAAALERYGAVLILSTRGLDQRGRELLAAYVRGGGGALLAAGPDVDGEVATGALGGAVTVATPLAHPFGDGAQTLAPADLRHPVFRAFATSAATLGLVRFSRRVTLRGPACQTIAQFTAGEPALLECRPGSGRVLVMASDLDGRWNDFPLHATFLPFLHEAARFLVGERTPPRSLLVGHTPPGVPSIPGFADLRVPNQSTPTRVAVNVDPRESDFARIDPSVFQTAIARRPPEPTEVRPVATQQQEERQRLWRFAIAVMVAALVAESLLAAKTA